MFFVLLFMLLVLAVAGAVLAYIAFPRRGAEIPRYPWVGEYLRRTVEALPTVHNVSAREGARPR